MQAPGLQPVSDSFLEPQKVFSATVTVDSLHYRIAIQLLYIIEIDLGSENG